MKFIIPLIILFTTYAQDKITLSNIDLYPSQGSITIQTNYQLSLLLPKEINSNSRIIFDFTQSDITTPSDGQLSTCYYQDVFDPNYIVTYTQCSCNSQLCTIIPSNSVSSLFTLIFGPISNPPFVKIQLLQITINYSPQYYSSESVTIPSHIYKPGSIQLDSLEQSSFKVAALNNLNLKITLSHPNLNGKLQITFPDDVTFYSNITVIDCITTILIPNKKILIEGSLKSNPLELTIQNTINPEFCGVSDSFMIQSLTPELYLVDQISEDVVLVTNQPEIVKIHFVGVYPGQSQVVSQQTVFYFILQPAVKYLSGGWLEIEFPPDIYLSSKIICIKILGMTAEEDYYCSKEGQKVRTHGLYYPNSQNQLMMTVSGALNPRTTKQTTTFKFKTFDAVGNLICISSDEVTYQAQPGSVSIEGISRSESRVSAETQVKYNFVTMNDFDGHLRLYIPGYEILNLGSYIMCEGSVGTGGSKVISCQIKEEVQGESGFTKLKISQLCDQKCLKNEKIQIKLLQSLSNPAFVYSQRQKLKISSYSQDDYLIDEGSQNILPVLSPIEVQDLVMRRLPVGTLDVKQDCELEFEFTIESEYFRQNNGNLMINFGEDVLIRVGQQCVKCVNEVYDEFDNVKSVKMNEVCGSVPCDNKISLKLSNLKVSYKSGITTNKFDIMGYTLDNMQIFKGSYDLQLNTNYLIGTTKSVQVNEKITGIKSQYQVMVDIEQPLQSVIEILLVGSQCLSTIDDVIVTCQCLNDRVRIQSQVNLNPQKLRISITEVQNPYSLRGEQIIVNQLYKDSIVMQWSINNKMEIARQMKSQISRSNIVVSKMTELVVKLEIDNKIKDQNFKVWIGLNEIELKNVQIKDINDNLIVCQIDQISKEIVFMGNGPVESESVLEYRVINVQNRENTKIVKDNCRIKMITYDNFDIQDSGAISILPQLIADSMVIKEIINDSENSILRITLDVKNANVEFLKCSSNLKITKILLNDQLIVEEKVSGNIQQTDNILQLYYTLQSVLDVNILLNTYQSTFLVDTATISYLINQEQINNEEEQQEVQQQEEEQQQEEQLSNQEEQLSNQEEQLNELEEQSQNSEEENKNPEEEIEEDNQNIEEQIDNDNIAQIKIVRATRSSSILFQSNQTLSIILSELVINTNYIQFQLQSIFFTGYESCQNGDIQFDCFTIRKPKSNQFTISNVTNQIKTLNQDQIIIDNHQLIPLQFTPLLTNQSIIFDSIQWKHQYINSQNASFIMILTIQSATNHLSKLAISFDKSTNIKFPQFQSHYVEIYLNNTEPQTQHQFYFQNIQLPNQFKLSSQIFIQLQPQLDSLVLESIQFVPTLKPASLSFSQLNATPSQWNFTILLSIPSISQQFITISFQNQPLKKGVSLNNIADNSTCLAKSTSNLECITTNTIFQLQGSIFSNQQQDYDIQFITVHDTDAVITHKLESIIPIHIIKQQCQIECLICESDQCHQCILGYYLLNNVCQKTCPGYITDEKCYECPQYCATCDSQTECRSCVEDYKLINNQCYQDQCSMDKCKYCLEQKCKECEFGYQLEDNECIQPYYNISAIVLLTLLFIVFIHFVIFAILPPKNTLKILMNALTDTSIMHTLCILITLVDRVYYLYFLEIYFLLLDLGYFNIYFGSTLQTSKCNVFWHYFCGGMTFRLPLTNFSKSHEQFNLSNYILIRNIHQYKIFLELIMSALFTISLCWTNLLYLISMLIEIMRAILLIMEYKYI